MIDLIIIGIIAFSILVSLWRGFVSEALSFGGWVVAFFIASSFYPYLSGHLAQVNSIYLQNSEFLRNGVAIAVLFVFSLIICSIVTALLGKLVETTGLGITDRILGGAFGALRGILIVAAALFFFDTFTTSAQSELWKQSMLIPHFDFIVQWFFEQIQANSSFLKSN